MTGIREGIWGGVMPNIGGRYLVSGSTKKKKKRKKNEKKNEKIQT